MPPRHIVQYLFRLIYQTGAAAVAAAFGFAAIRLFSNGLFYSPVNVDAGYFLSIADRFNDGWLPYRDIGLAYTPLGIWMLSIIERMFSPFGDSYTIYLCGVYTFTLVTAVLGGVAAYRLTSDLLLALLCTAAAAAGMASYEGVYVILEPSVTFFAMGALLIWLGDAPRTSKIIAASSLSCCAFLCKQYGLAAFAAIFGAIIVGPGNWREKGQQLAIAASGFLTVFLLGLGFLWLLGAPPHDVITALYIPGYLSRIGDLTSFKDFIFANPAVVLFPLLFLFPAFRRNQSAAVLGLFILFFLTPCIIRPFLHYYSLSIPFITIAGAYLISVAKTRHPLFGILFLSVFYPLAERTLSAPLFAVDPIERGAQMQEAAILRAALPPHAPVLLIAQPWLYYLGGFLPSDAHRPGYAFLSNYSAEDLIEFVKESHFIVFNYTDQGYGRSEIERIEARVGPFSQFLTQQGFERIQENHPLGRFEVWTKRDSG